MAAILKTSGEARQTSARGAVAFNFDDVTAKAQAYLSEVREQAEQILVDAQAEAEQVRQQARRDGRADADRDAVEAMQANVQQQLQFLIPAIQETVVEIERERAAWLRRWEENAVKLAIAIAQRVIRREISATPEITLDLVREALQMAAGMGTLRVRMNPTDVAALGQNLDYLVSQLKALAPAEVVHDPSITPGGCRVETDYGAIDQQVEAQLQRIREELSDAS